MNIKSRQLSQTEKTIIRQIKLGLKEFNKGNARRDIKLYEVLRQQILNGLFLPGMRLSSSRVLSYELAKNHA